VRAPARIHRGSVIHCWDHLVMTLHDDEGESAFLSLYAVAYSASLGGGHVALLEVPRAPAGPIAVTLADSDEIGRRMQDRLRSMGHVRAALAEPPVRALFERLAWRGSGFGFAVRGGGYDVEALWGEPSLPFWVVGEGGGFSATEDIWAMFVESWAPALTIGGWRAPGAPFDDPAWQDRLGRSLSSAHGAFAEVRVEPVSDRARESASG